MTTGLSLFFLCFTQVFYLGVYFSPRSTGSVSDVEGPINLAFCIMYCSVYVEIFHYYTSVSPTPLRYLYFFFFQYSSRIQPDISLECSLTTQQASEIALLELSSFDFHLATNMHNLRRGHSCRCKNSVSKNSVEHSAV